eukprot:4021675-Pleurochrysis_carterae.AAC.1
MLNPKPNLDPNPPCRVRSVVGAANSTACVHVLAVGCSYACARVPVHAFVHVSVRMLVSLGNAAGVVKEGSRVRRAAVHRELILAVVSSNDGSEIEELCASASKAG